MTDTITNKNLLPVQGFRMILKRTPLVNYWIQRAPIPQSELGVIRAQTPLSNWGVPGDHLTFYPFEVTFKCDEDMTNYLEIMNWLVGLGKPDTFAQYRALKAGRPEEGLGIYSDIVILITDSKRNVNLEVTYVDCFPYWISEVAFDSRVEDVDFITASVKFAHSGFTIARI